MQTVFSIAVLIMSVVVHEVAHGYMAYRFGDNTALYAKRLTLNPIRHLDWFGSIVLPALLVLSGTGLVFGWAKPVPYNPNNLNPKRKGEFWVASAGIIVNMFLAIVFGLVMRIAVSMDVVSVPFYFITGTIVAINLMLTLFNLIPVPPLDGSKILFNLMPAHWYKVREFMERYAIAFIIIVFLFVGQLLFPVVSFLFTLLTGFPL
jgi:Zn-dependent protease